MACALRGMSCSMLRCRTQALRVSTHSRRISYRRRGPPPPQLPSLDAAEARALLRILELEPHELDPQRIKSRYFALAKKIHPDVQRMGERENNSQPWLRFADLTLGFEKLIAHTLRLQQDAGDATVALRAARTGQDDDAEDASAPSAAQRQRRARRRRGRGVVQHRSGAENAWWNAPNMHGTHDAGGGCGVDLDISLFETWMVSTHGEDNPRPIRGGDHAGSWGNKAEADRRAKTEDGSSA